MSTIDTAALREKATPIWRHRFLNSDGNLCRWRYTPEPTSPRWVNGNLISGFEQEELAAVSPDVLIALLDELERKTKAEREAVVELARAGSHLREFARYHPEECTADIEASLFMVGLIVGKYTAENDDVLDYARTAMAEARATLTTGADNG